MPAFPSQVGQATGRRSCLRCASTPWKRFDHGLRSGLSEFCLPLLPLMHDGLNLARLLPRLLPASATARKQYSASKTHSCLLKIATRL